MASGIGEFLTEYLLAVPALLCSPPLAFCSPQFSRTWICTRAISASLKRHSLNPTLTPAGFRVLGTDPRLAEPVASVCEQGRSLPLPTLTPACFWVLGTDPRLAEPVAIDQKQGVSLPLPTLTPAGFWVLGTDPRLAEPVATDQKQGVSLPLPTLTPAGFWVLGTDPRLAEPVASVCEQGLKSMKRHLEAGKQGRKRENLIMPAL